MDVPPINAFPHKREYTAEMNGEAINSRKQKAIVSLLALAAISLSTLGLADNSYQGNFLFGAELGIGWIEIDRSEGDSHGTWLYGALRGEYLLLNDLALGLEGSGWTDQEDTNSPISEDILSFMLTARYFPFNDYGVNLKAGWGKSKHRFWNSSSKADTSGDSYTIGLSTGLGPSVNVSYSWGELEQGDFSALTFSFGATF